MIPILIRVAFRIARPTCSRNPPIVAKLYSITTITPLLRVLKNVDPQRETAISISGITAK
jgi:hypothetical protein